MFPAQSLLSLALIVVFLGTNVIAAPNQIDVKATLQFARRLSLLEGTTIAESDRARAKVLKANGLAAQAYGQPIDRRAISIPANNTSVAYTVTIGCGTPPTHYTLLVDTGSANTWIGASKKYVKTSSSVNTGKAVSVSYGSGSFSGTEYTDTITLSSALVATKQSIGVASTSSGFSGIDGILGLGPSDLTEGTVSGVPNIPTIIEILYSEGKVTTEVIGIYFVPATLSTPGELTFGGTDSTKYTGSITYTPITTTSPASLYWGINQSITYGTTSILSTTAGIVDTGTTLVLIATDAYNKYVTATGAKLDSTTGLLKITAAQYAKLSSLNFHIAGTVFPLTANGQIWPRSLNTDIGGTSGSIYLIIGNLGSNSGEGLDFIDGYTFLERFYSVYDTTNSRVGFATTQYTTSTGN